MGAKISSCSREWLARTLLAGLPEWTWLKFPLKLAHMETNNNVRLFLLPACADRKERLKERFPAKTIQEVHFALFVKISGITSTKIPNSVEQDA